MDWFDRSFLVGMPHLIPGQLSDVELFKVLGDAQWQSISRLLDIPSAKIVNDTGERLYASFINIDLSYGTKAPVDLGEGTELFIRHAARFYARRFVEGFFVFDDAALAPDAHAGISSRADLERLSCPWVYLTNAFVAREDSNSRLKTFAPSSTGTPLSTDVLPPGIRDHEHVERTGALSLPGMAGATSLAADGLPRISYEILPESDLNGAGLLYFARYVAMANYGERLFLRGHPTLAVSSRIASLLTTTRRRIFYFANANEGDRVELAVSAYLAKSEDGALSSAVRTAPLKLYFTTELRRASDGVLMAMSATEKHLVIPKRHKTLLLEAGRLAKRVGLDIAV